MNYVKKKKSNNKSDNKMNLKQFGIIFAMFYNSLYYNDINLKFRQENTTTKGIHNSSFYNFIY